MENMNKRILVIVVALAAIVIAAVAMLSIGTAQNPNSSASNNSSESDSSTGSREEPNSTPVENDGAGEYVEYSTSAIAEADGRVLLFFHAPWCPQCVTIDDDIAAEGVPSGVTIIKVDYDSNQDLRAEYGVTQQTTFVEVNSSGEKLRDNFVAYADPTLQTVLTAFL
ncbi:thioredoxin [Rhodoglobus vestalii]|uniref:Thioredoxin n=2 Tax=Rhodoglobus vestalii TaxID=193384 RepID=A0A8H2PZ43_9MICO|nr:thioredoxin [Rhodoglobus vestalii]